MPRIRCNYEGCIHLEKNFCTAGEIELDQELGCLTYSQVEDEEDIAEEVLDVGEGTDEEWEEEFDEEEDEEEDLDWDEDEEDDWDDEDEDEEGWSSPRRRR